MNDSSVEDEWAAALQEQQQASGTTSDSTAPADDPWKAALEEQQNSSKTPHENPLASLKNFDETDFSKDFSSKNPDINLILDIPVHISMEVGSTEISIRHLLHLNQGSVIELDRFAGEPLDVMVNGTLIAHGEVVVVNEKFGIRLTDILNASERIEKIQ
jgi:flagellar motor switch protein FliN/FliY